MSEEGKAEPLAAEASAAASQSQTEEPVESIEGDDGDDGEKDGAVVTQDKASGVTEDQWRSMMDIVIAIYDYREEECVIPCICLPCALANATVFPAAMILPGCSSAASINDMFPTTTI